MFPFESIPSPEALTTIYPPPIVMSAFESLLSGLPPVDELEDEPAALIPSSLAVISILPPVTVTF